MQNFSNYQMAVRDLDKVTYFKLPLGPSDVLDAVDVEDTGQTYDSDSILQRILQGCLSRSLLVNSIGIDTNSANYC